MNDLFLYCNFNLESFYPSKFIDYLTEFEIISMNDSGGKELIDRDTLGTLSFGSLTIAPKRKITNDFKEIYAKFMEDLLVVKSEFSNAEIEVVVHLDIAYETQCNFELSKDEINFLKTLNATFSITCYQK
jgi:hypothetical protein